MSGHETGKGNGSQEGVKVEAKPLRAKPCTRILKRGRTGGGQEEAMVKAKPLRAKASARILKRGRTRGGQEEAKECTWRGAHECTQRGDRMDEVSIADGEARTRRGRRGRQDSGPESTSVKRRY